jgi:hypothetical protein
MSRVREGVAMRVRKQTGKDVSMDRPGRVQKRRPRSGPRRSINIGLCADHALWLDVHAARQLTTPAEIVMDWIDQARRRKPGEPADGGEAAAAEAAA